MDSLVASLTTRWWADWSEECFSGMVLIGCVKCWWWWGQVDTFYHQISWLYSALIGILCSLIKIIFLNVWYSGTLAYPDHSPPSTLWSRRREPGWWWSLPGLSPSCSQVPKLLYSESSSIQRKNSISAQHSISLRVSPLREDLIILSHTNHVRNTFLYNLSKKSVFQK